MASKRKKNTRDYGKTYGYDDGGKVDQMRDRGLRDLRRMMLFDRQVFGNEPGPGLVQRVDEGMTDRSQTFMERNNEYYRNRGRRRKED